MRVLLIDGHPDADRLSAHLLDVYQQALPAGIEVTRLAIRDMAFDADRSRGYEDVPPLDLDRAAALAAIEGYDHLLLAFALWWGGEPARMKGFRDRLPKGRSADLLVTMDTQPPYLRLVYFDPIGPALSPVGAGFRRLPADLARLFRDGPARRGRKKSGNMARPHPQACRQRPSAEARKENRWT